VNIISIQSIMLTYCYALSKLNKHRPELYKLFSKLHATRLMKMWLIFLPLKTCSSLYN
jgi:hypothetical protein